MFLKPFEINRQSTVSEIVNRDFRTAEVFRRYSIPYCCGAKIPLEIACEMYGADSDELINALESAVRTVTVSNVVDYSKWEPNFLVDYIINIHHHYLKEVLPFTRDVLNEFISDHLTKFPYLGELEKKFNALSSELLAAVQSEEDVLFPYIKQLAHAYKHNEPYAALFIRTLRKPVEEILYKSHNNINQIISSIRSMTNLYTVPPHACTSHKVVLSKLKELDNDMMQHFYLEKSILFPKAIEIEKAVLNDNT